MSGFFNGICLVEKNKKRGDEYTCNLQITSWEVKIYDVITLKMQE